MLVLFLFSFLFSLTAACEANCETCRDLFQGDYACLACKSGFELVTTYNICIQDSSIQNCALYDQTLDCLQCQPTFKQSVNFCTKMFDGCLLYENNGCSVCLQGSYFNNDTKACTLEFLNCKNISSKGKCIDCYDGYILRNGRCADSSTQCITMNADTEICGQCKVNYTLLGFICVPKDNKAAANCYMARKDSNITCQQCKMGYGGYFGSCIPLKQIIKLLSFNDSDCSNVQYLKDNQVSCLVLTGKTFNNCLSVDFGFESCLICKDGYLPDQKGQCGSIINRLCANISANGVCLSCKEMLYLKQGHCLPYPPFCLNYSDGCTKCQDSFKLIRGKCQDPNCQTINPITDYCQLCLINYMLSPGGICRYVDPNCKRSGPLGDCVECLKGYYLKNNGLCGVEDVNCLSFDNQTGLCALCKPFYYFNSQGQICIPLPSNCIRADLAGRCVECQAQYTLTSGYQCLFIDHLPNCKMVSQSNFSRCSTCVDGFFSDAVGKCQRLPPFCNQVDRMNYQCTQCSPNGLMKGSTCVDKNCQIFDSQGLCLACLRSFQFGQLGECVPETRDANCKEYQYGVCKACAQRYYFDFQFNCIPVSPFCQTYDANSGECTSCYGGYQLTNNGDCTIVPFNSLYAPFDVLVESCKVSNQHGQCIECNPNYNQVPLTTDVINGSKPVVSCIRKILSNSYCLQLDNNTDKCVQCVSRMYVDRTGKCQGIDENCQKYNRTTGVCISCYYGFMLSADNKTCSIINGDDPKCEIKGKPSGCVRCYQGYYFNAEMFVCVMVDQQCATYNQNNGNCLSCYSGYQLQDGKCIVKTANSPRSSGPSNSNNTTGGNQSSSIQLTPPGCLNMDFNAKKCLTCQWGYAMVDSLCVQKDPNCQTFQDKNSIVCTTCYQGYVVFPNDQTKCVLQQLILDNCLKYNPTIECIQCKNGYVLKQNHPGVTPPFLCNPLDPNCHTFNFTTNSCDQCIEGTVLQGRVCVYPIYGIDPNCVLYVNRICESCRSGWKKVGYVCSQDG